VIIYIYIESIFMWQHGSSMRIEWHHLKLCFFQRCGATPCAYMRATRWEQKTMLCSPFCHFYLPIYPCILVETLVYQMLTLCFRLDVFLCMETHVSQVMIDMNYLQLIYFAAGAWNLQPPWLWDWWVPEKSTIASLNDRSCGWNSWVHRSIQQDVGFSNKSWLLVQDKKGALKCCCASEIGYDTVGFLWLLIASRSTYYDFQSCKSHVLDIWGYGFVWDLYMGNTGPEVILLWETLHVWNLISFTFWGDQWQDAKTFKNPSYGNGYVQPFRCSSDRESWTIFQSIPVDQGVQLPMITMIISES
jgi:hypothetical protein